ncbi:hypothetical protein ACPA9J_27060 [Pseudomonas aeruginosa]
MAARFAIGVEPSIVAVSNYVVIAWPAAAAAAGKFGRRVGAKLVAARIWRSAAIVGHRAHRRRRKQPVTAPGS